MTERRKLHQSWATFSYKYTIDAEIHIKRFQERNDARALIERFAKKQRDRHFACPRCGKMTMDAECVTRNALSRRTEIYVCDACGTQEAIEDMMDSQIPLTAWAIVAAPENWRMKEGSDNRKPRG